MLSGFTSEKLITLPAAGMTIMRGHLYSLWVWLCGRELTQIKIAAVDPS
jgi:hypothetical protein